MSRVYKCPICGKPFSSLPEMYACAQKCEKEEKDIENKKKLLEEQRKTDKAAIDKNYQKLLEDIKAYNEKYKIPYIAHNSSLSFEKKDWTKKTEKNLNETMEDILRDIINGIIY